MSKLFDACVVESSYEKNGETKNTYRKVGTMFVNDKGNMSLKLDRFFNPLGALNKNRECWVTLFEQKNEARPNNRENGPHLEGDVPF